MNQGVKILQLIKKISFFFVSNLSSDFTSVFELHLHLWCDWIFV